MGIVNKSTRMAKAFTVSGVVLSGARSVSWRITQ